MKNVLDFDEAGRIPMPGDNVAIAIKRLPGGTRYVYRDRVQTLSHTILEGHRFAMEPIAQGQPLLSWGLPFGVATRAIKPGEYICNAKILEALKHRNIDFPLPAEPNFVDQLVPYVLNEKKFKPGHQVTRHPEERFFDGYPRGGVRGVGTRNIIAILGTTSLTAGFARALENRMKGVAEGFANIDGIVAVTHTEGGGTEVPNNLDFLLRTLSGFIVHPNIGAVLAVDFGTEVVTNRMLEAYLREHGYPLEEVTHAFYSVGEDFQSALDECESLLRGWLEVVNGQVRQPQPVSQLKIALQCGGSDAFSGVAGNPLAGWVAKEVIRYGGSANLAETDELIGAEAYILNNTRDLTTARKFLEKIAIFKERVRWHGHTAEGNPSGGNNFRGLYNIAIKSIGAARKRDPEVCLDYVIDYGERMGPPGYYFMDSPGNDLESIAGQVASGSNMIFFITGNGSVTNFPFVPTIKFITTTGRYELLSKDMDVNAGRYQDGTPMDELGAETFEYLVRVASGERSVGEKAGHSQVSIWRNWRQKDDSHLEELQHQSEPEGRAIPLKDGHRSSAVLPAVPAARGFAVDQVALVIPTSICSSQIARMIADDLNKKNFAQGRAISRVVALPHTEGCGASGGENERHFTRLMVGHLVHPFVRKAVLLEHGCEKVHNDAMRLVLTEEGIPLDEFGWASVQLDGGIESVVAKVESWLADRLPLGAAPAQRKVGIEALPLAVTTVHDLPETAARALGRLVGGVVRAGGTVVVAENATAWQSPGFPEEIAPREAIHPTLAYGRTITGPGLHVMATPTDHAVETLTGLGATGVQVMLAHVTGPPLMGHPMVPLAQITADRRTGRLFHRDLDRVIAEGEGPEAIAEALLQLIVEVASHTYQPRLWSLGNTDFQVTRGLLGVSM